MRGDAGDLICEQGLQDVAMSQIVQRAQVGMGTIYDYFPSKEDLVICLFSEIKAAMTEHVLGGYDTTHAVAVRVVFLLASMVWYGIEHPREFLLANQLALVPFIQERAKGEVSALVAGLKQVLIDATPVVAESDAAWCDDGADHRGNECAGRSAHDAAHSPGSGHH